MASIKFNGKKPTLSAMREMRMMMRGIGKYGNNYTENRFFVFEGSKVIAGQETKPQAMKFMKNGRTLFTIFD